MALTSFFSALTGLNANSHTINTIGDNLANMNTIGFKAGKATFAEIIGGMSGFSATGNPMVFGQGAMLNGIVHKQVQGTPEYTGNSTDAMIMGSGYFVVKTGDGGIGYTRAGRFQFDKTGNLVSSDGYQLMGYMADEQGNINNAAGIKPIEIRMGQFVPAQKTTTVSAAVNLDSQAKAGSPGTSSVDGTPTTVVEIGGYLDENAIAGTEVEVTCTVYGTGGTPYEVLITFKKDSSATEWEWEAEIVDDTTTSITGNSGTLEFTSGSVSNGETQDITIDGVQIEFNFSAIIGDASGPDGVTFESQTGGTPIDPGTPPAPPTVFVTPIEIYDSLGTQHVVQLIFTKTSQPGVSEPEWKLEAKLLLDSGNPNKPYTLDVDINGLTDNLLKFDSSGNLEGNMPNTLKLNIGTSPDLPPELAGTLNTMSGQTLTLDLRDSRDNSMFTSAASTSATSSTFQNGFAASNLASVAFDNNGVVIGIAANGNQINLAQLAVATFVNVEGLQKYNGSTLIASGNAGEPSIGVANSGSRGAINGGSLEMSNVDMSEEFINLIIAQRAFQANARVITTSDELYQEAIHLKR